MIDLTPALADVLRQDRQWTREDAPRAMKDVAARVSGQVDCDDYAGESWGRVLLDDQVTAFLFLHRPVVLVTDAFREAVGSALGPEVVAVSVPALTEPALTADRDLLVTVFGPGASSSAVNPSAFAADDLWYATV